MQVHPPRSEYVNLHPYCLHLWNDMWQERVYWLKHGVETMHTEQDIAREFSDTVTNEMTVTISDGTLQEIVDRSEMNLSEELQDGGADENE